MELLFKQRTGDSKNTEKSIIAYFNGKNKPQISTKIKVKPSNFLNQKVVKIYDKHRINALLDRMRLLFKEEQLEYKRNKCFRVSRNTKSVRCFRGFGWV